MILHRDVSEGNKILPLLKLIIGLKSQLVNLIKTAKVIMSLLANLDISKLWAYIFEVCCEVKLFFAMSNAFLVDNRGSLDQLMCCATDIRGQPI